MRGILNRVPWLPPTCSEVSDPVSQSTHLLRPWMQPARSLVMAPLSTVSTHTFSSVCANLQGDAAVRPQIGWAEPWGWTNSSSPRHAHLMRSWFPSSFPRCSRPLVQAKMLAIGLVLVGRPWGQAMGSTAESHIDPAIHL